MHRRTLPVTIRIVLRRLHITFGINRIIVTPVRDGAAGNSHLETLAVRQGVARHKAAIAPTPNSNARAIDVGLALQPGDAVFQIAQFQFTEVLVNRPG